MSKLIRPAGPIGTAPALLCATPAQAASSPPWGTATGEIVIATLGAGILPPFCWRSEWATARGA